MNQMLKKASSVCTAFALCRISDIFRYIHGHGQHDEMDDTVKTQIETYAEGLTDDNYWL